MAFAQPLELRVNFRLTLAARPPPFSGRLWSGDRHHLGQVMGDSRRQRHSLKFTAECGCHWRRSTHLAQLVAGDVSAGGLCASTASTAPGFSTHPAATARLAAGA
jgi:hypothetical protein